MASDGRVVGLTFGAGNDIYYASSTDFGRSFSKPVKVGTKGFLSLGRHRGPRIAIQSGHVVVSAIAGAKGRGADGDLWAWRSKDEEEGWQGPVRINDVEGSAREGLHGMAAGYGVVAAVWLDLRQKGTRLYSSVSRDGGKTWGKNTLVYESPDGHICECCHPSVAVGDGGTVYVMFRNALGGSRDMYLSVSRDGGKSFATEKLGHGTWKLNACPMDGGGLVAAGGGAQTVWRRESSIFVARPGEKEMELGPGKDASIATGLDKTDYAIWVWQGAVMLRSSRDEAAKVLAEKGDYPQLIMTGKGGLLAAWEQENGIVVQPVH